MDNNPFFSFESGARQGENLSPVLFSIFLNDLESHLIIKGCEGVTLSSDIDEQFWLRLLVLLYADDTILLAETPHELQNILNHFSEYCKQWKLTVNLEKTKVVVFGARNYSNQIFRFDNKVIAITNNYKYLGLLFISNGSFFQCTQAKRAMHSVLAQSRALNLPLDLQLKLFDHMVVPILLYGGGGMGP